MEVVVIPKNFDVRAKEALDELGKIHDSVNEKIMAGARAGKLMTELVLVQYYIDEASIDILTGHFEEAGAYLEKINSGVVPKEAHRIDRKYLKGRMEHLFYHMLKVIDEMRKYPSEQEHTLVQIRALHDMVGRIADITNNNKLVRYIGLLARLNLLYIAIQTEANNVNALMKFLFSYLRGVN